MNICVYCASSSVVDDVYFREAEALGAAIAKGGHRVVHGAGNIGLMAAIGQAARETGGEVVGVIPGFLNDRGLADAELTELHVTPDMRSRKRKMEELADAFITLPGGFGTLEEIFEIITLKQLGRHNKACVILNVSGFFDPLIEQIERGFSERFIKERYRGLFHVAADATDALDHIENYRPADHGEKWFSAENGLEAAP